MLLNIFHVNVVCFRQIRVNLFEISDLLRVKLINFGIKVSKGRMRREEKMELTTIDTSGFETNRDIGCHKRFGSLSEGNHEGFSTFMVVGKG